MLYEVITDVDLVQLHHLGDEQDLPRHAGRLQRPLHPLVDDALVGGMLVDDRITSYNVCYTKLLRHDLAALGIPTMGDYVEAYVIRTGLDPRITSYNVCYTKLLRDRYPGKIVARTPFRKCGV